MTERVVVIGVSGVDRAGFRDAAARGMVPNMAALGTAASLRPAPDGIAAWATIASGVPAARHGVVHDREGWAGGLRATGRASWMAAPLWQRLAAAGVATASAAWPGVRPGAAWAGSHVDDSYAVATGNCWDDWALPPRCAPPAVREALRDRRVHPTDIATAQLLPLVPQLAAVDQERDPGLALLAVGMAQAATVQAAAAWLLEHDPARAVWVHHRWLGEVRTRVPEAAPAPWDKLFDGAWRFLDGLVGHLVATAGGARIVLVSPGWRGAPGLLIATGGSSRFDGASPLGIAPLVLSGLGLAELPEVAPVPPVAASDDLDRIVALGYPPPPGPPLAWQVERLTARARLLLADDPAAAAVEADAALALAPENLDALSQRAAAHIALGEADALPPLADALSRLAPARPWGSLVHGARHALNGDAAAARPWLFAAEAAGELDTSLRAGAAWLVLNRAADAERAFAAVLAAAPGHPEATIGLAAAALARGDLYRAEQSLRTLIAADPEHGVAWSQLAAVLERGGRTREAAAARATAGRLAGSHG